ncbi:MAG: NADH-quinone oxidoreductase subunit A [Phycisphaerales bacterium]|jgi:NADH-quinone oxidoreductase subunit A|nr:NADH-quinone oxidoreductase subunit A [Phycisphaeraceae bacterium]
MINASALFGSLLANVEVSSYLPILLLLTIAIGFAVTNLLASQLLGPKRKGNVKQSTYESGMNPVGTARKRFNVRFYLIAMVFLVFDIEIIFLYPWAVTFPSLDHEVSNSGIWLGRIVFFILTTVVAYVYGYRKGVFKFD